MTQPIVGAAAVSVKLPDFWPRSPTTWFTQAEAQFRVAAITSDETKYYHIVAKLDQQTAIRISDLLENPPETDKYTGLKARLTDTFSRTPLERAEALLEIESLAGRKPSELADDMIAMAGTAVQHDCPLFAAIFLRTLPPSVKQHLMTEEKITDLRKIAKQADRLIATTPEHSVVHQVKKSTGPKREKSTVCFYHKKWGSKAYKCKQPCSFGREVKSVTIDAQPEHGNPDSGNEPAGRC